MTLVEIFDDRQRLDQRVSLHHERRHEALWVDAEKLGLSLVAPAQMDKGGVVIELFEIEGDAHAKRGGGSKIAVELHGRRPSQTAVGRDVTPPASSREDRARFGRPYRAGRLSPRRRAADELFDEVEKTARRDR